MVTGVILWRMKEENKEKKAEQDISGVYELMKAAALRSIALEASSHINNLRLSDVNIDAITSTLKAQEMLSKQVFQLSLDSNTFSV